MFKKKPRNDQALSQSTLKQNIKSTMTNILYFASGSLNKIWSSKSNDKESYILGKKYNNQMQTLQSIKKVIWFTYRKNFYISQQYHSDAGWGCVLRVGQMLLGQALQTYFKQRKGRQLTSQQRFSLIQAFLDQDSKKQKYSINKIVKFGQKQIQKQPGEWYQLSQMGRMLEVLQNRNLPMQSSNNLRVAYFSDSTIYLKDIYKLMQTKQCQCKNKSVLCQKCHKNYFQSFDNNYKNHQKEFVKKKKLSFQEASNQAMEKNSIYQSDISDNNEKNVLIIVITRLGFSHPEIELYKGMLQYMSQKQSIGVIGGFPKKALYFIGHQNEELIYLDPHFVQDAPKAKNLQKHLSSFSCNQKRKTKGQSIDPSVGFCFYIKDLQDLNQLVICLDKVKQMKKNSICYQWNQSGIDHLSDYQTTESKNLSQYSNYQYLY